MSDEIPALPEGIVTFMLTDLEGSTWLWDTYQEKMKIVLARHDKLIEAIVVEHAGIVIKPRGEGDSCFIVFPRASDALLAAAEIQLAMANEQWIVPEKIRMRIAVHTGEAELREGDYYGPTVNRCARLRGIAHGGQTLISQVTYSLVYDSVPTTFKFLDLGEHKLKDIRRAERIYQLLAPGLPADFPPLRTPNQLLQNLPLTLTSFIGREKEVVEIKNLLATRRLITISGSGGVGKTRLAVQAASVSAELFPDGGHFIDLARITDSDLVIQTVMIALGITGDNCCDPAERFAYYFQDKTMLLVLDNCEHVLPGATKLTQLLLNIAARLTILATSREPLGVLGETVWYISPLSTPRVEGKPTLEALMAYEAIALFVDRATAISDFVLTRENAESVVQVCARLEGIPLALELAAARTKVLSVSQLAQRLEKQFDLLESNQQVPIRQKTLRNLIDWSYDLLLENEKILLRRLSIFAGGWTLQATEEICVGDGLDSSEVLDLLIHLVDRSMVLVETVAEDKRYRLLETIRQYSHERLAESLETEHVAYRHATYYLRVAEQAAAELWGRWQGFYLERLDIEYNNLLAALEWIASTSHASDLMLRFTGALWRYWRVRGQYQDGRKYLGIALAHNPDGPRDLRAEALRGAGILAIQQGDYELARALMQESLALYTEIQNKRGIGRTLEGLGEIAYYQGDYAHATVYQSQSLAQRTEIDDREGMANSLRQLGVLARDQGDFQEAKQRLQRSLEIGRDLADQILMAKILDSLGLVEHHLCQYDRARELFSEAVRIYQELNDRLGISNTLQNLGNAAKDQGDFKQAKAIYGECLKLKQALGDKRGIAQALASLAELAFYQGKYLDSAELASRSLTLFKDLGVKRGIVFTLGLLAYIAQYNGESERAAELANECMKISTELNAPRPKAYCKEVFGLIAYAQDDLIKARQLLTEATELFEKVGDRRNVANARINLARIFYRQGDYKLAFRYVNESLATARELNIQWTLSLALEINGLIQRSQHNDEIALDLFKNSLLISVEQDNRQGIANCLGAIAGLAVIGNQPNVAPILFAAAQKIRREIGAQMVAGDREEYEYYLALARQQLTEDEFYGAWSRGMDLDFEQVVTLTNIEPPTHSLGILTRMEVAGES